MWISTSELRRGAFGKPGASFLFSRKGALTHHPEGAVVLPAAIVRSPPRQEPPAAVALRHASPRLSVRGEYGCCDSLWTMPHFCQIAVIVHAVDGCVVVLHPPTACANLPLAALPQLWVCSSPEHTHFLFAKKTKREDGENEWRSTIWKRKSSAGAQDEAPLLPQRT